MSASAWTLASVLPNLQLCWPIDTLSGVVAMVPHSDRRLATIRATSNAAAKLLDGFRDIYSNRLEPSAVIVRDDAPEKVKTVNALVDFRNCVAMSSIAPGYAQLRPPTGTPINPLWSEAFAFYPIKVSRSDTLITITPAVNIGSSPGTPFMGMPNPGLVVYSDRFHIDFRLLGLLLQAWERRYVRPGREAWNLRAVFRSMEMAYRALEVPIANESSVHDSGTTFALWVSAFEILAHAAKREGEVGEADVLDALSKVPWADPRLHHRRYAMRRRRKKKASTKKGPSKPVPKKTLAESMYHALYEARNTFLHGNQVRTQDWRYSTISGASSLGNLAPVLYRSVLVSHMGWRWTKPLARRMMDGDVFRAGGRVPSGRGIEIMLACSDGMYETCLLSFLAK